MAAGDRERASLRTVGPTGPFPGTSVLKPTSFGSSTCRPPLPGLADRDGSSFACRAIRVSTCTQQVQVHSSNEQGHAAELPLVFGAWSSTVLPARELLLHGITGIMLEELAPFGVCRVLHTQGSIFWGSRGRNRKGVGSSRRAPRPLPLVRHCSSNGPLHHARILPGKTAPALNTRLENPGVSGEGWDEWAVVDSTI
jgi:hypothetical protein